jgi:alkylhydroperoxidase/carboxymuconolactone decarboxylase family protein YurZ
MLSKSRRKELEVKKQRSTLARKGEVVRRKIHGNAHVDRNYAEADEFMSVFQDVTDEFCWGTVWARPGLDQKTRAALSLVMGAAQNHTGAVKLHVKTCLRTGWKENEIAEMLLHVYVYAGVYPSLSAFQIAREAIAEFKQEGQGQAARSGRRTVIRHARPTS